MARTERVRRKLRRTSCILVLTILTAASVSLAAPQVERNSGGSLPQAGGPTPRAADGHPDLSGVWFPDMRQYGPQSVAADAATVPFQPWAAAKIKSMSAVDLELGRPSVNCMPRGTPGMFFLSPYPIKLVQTRDELIQLDELNTNFRVIHTDGRPHTKNPDPTFAGDATAHWERDTLVIDVIAIDERTWNNFIGWFHSDQEHVIERITRPSENSLIYQVTIEDPKVLTKPWTSPPRQWTLHHEDLEEYYCTDNQEVLQYESIKGQKEGGK